MSGALARPTCAGPVLPPHRILVLRLESLGVAPARGRAGVGVAVLESGGIAAEVVAWRGCLRRRSRSRGWCTGATERFAAGEEYGNTQEKGRRSGPVRAVHRKKFTAPSFPRPGLRSSQRPGRPTASRVARSRAPIRSHRIQHTGRPARRLAGPRCSRSAA